MGYPSSPELGWYYVVSVAGEVEGVQYEVGDWIVWNGTSWDRVAGQRTVFPVGTIMMYDGTMIANVETRAVQIGDDVGDQINMKGWFVCNGLAGTPDLEKMFVRGAYVSGGMSGSDDSIVVQHNHGASQEVHTHNVKGTKAYVGIEPTAERLMLNNLSGEVTDYMSNEMPAVTVESEGVSGVGKNVPKHYKVIYIIRKN